MHFGKLSFANTAALSLTSSLYLRQPLTFVVPCLFLRMRQNARPRDCTRSRWHGNGRLKRSFGLLQGLEKLSRGRSRATCSYPLAKPDFPFGAQNFDEPQSSKIWCRVDI